MKDSDDGPVIWFALAETQWKLGRLEDRVRDKVIEIIDSGASLDRWREESDKLAAKRQKVLLELKEKLLSPQPERKVIRVRKPTKIATWKAGELFAYRLLSGNWSYSAWKILTKTTMVLFPPSIGRGTRFPMRKRSRSCPAKRSSRIAS